MEKKELQQALRESWKALHEKDRQHKQEIEIAKEEVLHDLMKFIHMQPVDTKEQAKILLYVDTIIEEYRHALIERANRKEV